MPVSIPRLVRDKKTGIFMFRLVLPRRISSTQKQQCVYVSLKTRENKQARAIAAVLNLRIELNKPLIDLEHIRNLTTFELPGGLKVSGDTPEEAGRGLELLMAFKQQGKMPSSMLAGMSPEQTTTAVVAPESQKTTHLLANVANELFAEISNTHKPTTIYKYSKTFEKFIRQFPGALIATIALEHVVAFKKAQLAVSTAHTVNGMLGNLEKLFDFAMANGYMPRRENPAFGLKIKGSKKQLKKRAMFFDDQLSPVLDWDNYREYCIRPDYFWGPLISLFSGLRPEEITSLTPRSFQSEDGVRFMHIVDAKTAAGNRKVPVHSYLIKLGLLRYVHSVKEEKAIFAYLIDGKNGPKKNTNGTKKNLSRHFSSYLIDSGVKADNNCLYSIRHTVINRFVAKGNSQSLVYAVSGHKTDDNAHYGYLHPDKLPIVALQGVIESLDFHETYDLSKFDYLQSLDVDRRRGRRTKAEMIVVKANRLKAKRARPVPFTLTASDDDFAEGQKDD